MNSKNIIVIDGSRGEGGGQILRTSLSLAMCLQQPVRIENIRAGRKRPGLMRQHLAGLRAATQVSAATVHGDELGSTQIEFRPDSIRAGDYRIAIGSAGSTTLALQTILPALLQANAPSTVELEGGTHNGMAPSYDFLQLSFAPVLARMGAKLELKFDRHGFYPNGGGSFTARVVPATQWQPLSLMQAPEQDTPIVHIAYAHMPASIAEREAKHLMRKASLPPEAVQIHAVESPGPGNVVSMRATNEGFSNVFDSYAARGLKAERVAGRALRDYRQFCDDQVAVDVHLADQILLPLALGAGGEFLTGELTEHTHTNIAVIGQLSGQTIGVERLSATQYKVCVPGRRA